MSSANTRYNKLRRKAIMDRAQIGPNQWVFPWVHTTKSQYLRALRKAAKCGPAFQSAPVPGITAETVVEVKHYIGVR